MRSSRSISIVLAALFMAGAIAEPAQARRPRRAYASAPTAPAVRPLVSLSLERPGGSGLPSYLHGGSLYFAGQQGERYDLRLTNNTGDRVEVVVTVDGRDVVSGELGNYKRQRGYVLDPWATVVIDGFRQSLENVAAFRFSGLEQSYTGLRGTPQYAGVVGVAVFKEHKRSARRHRRAVAKAQPPPPYYEPYYQGAGSTSAPTPFPESSSRRERAVADEADAAPVSSSARSGEAFTAPAAEPSRQLGTAYGESRHSAVQEVPFKRRKRRRPDAFLTVYYDSLEGLQARGVAMTPAPPTEPRPFPRSGFAPPPPR
ncbi:MAG: hypothetical protein AAGF11_15870 [Myxococcota bacterium]